MLSQTVWLLVLPNLGLGGAQRQALLLAKYVRQRGAKVTLVLTDVNSQRELAHYDPGHIPTLVARRHCRWDLRIALMVMLLASPVLGIVRKLIQGDLADRLELTLNSRTRWILDRVLWRGDRFETRAARDYIRNFPRVIFALSGLRSIARKERPDFVLSFLTKTNLNSIVALSGEKNSGPVLAVCERNDVCRQSLAAGLERGREELYPLANSVFANSRHAVEDLNEMNPSLNSQWLPNLALAATVEPGAISSRSAVPSKRFVVVGRLEASKRT